MGEVGSDEGNGVVCGRAGVKKRWSVALPVDLPSLNAFMRWHFRKRSQWCNQIEQYIFCMGSPLVHFTNPVSVNIVREFGYRKRDYDTDNLYASVKPVLDALKTPRGRMRRGLSVIVEDNPKWCQLTVTQRKSKDKKTRILVEVVDL